MSLEGAARRAALEAALVAELEQLGPADRTAAVQRLAAELYVSTIGSPSPRVVRTLARIMKDLEYG